MTDEIRQDEHNVADREVVLIILKNGQNIIAELVEEHESYRDGDTMFDAYLVITNESLLKPMSDGNIITTRFSVLPIPELENNHYTIEMSDVLMIVRNSEKVRKYHDDFEAARAMARSRLVPGSQMPKGRKHINN